MKQSKTFALILAIVLVPLLHAFTTAARVNAKAKNNFRATTVAQTLMEQMSAYTMEENVLAGGFGSAILEFLTDARLTKPPVCASGASRKSSARKRQSKAPLA